jgi:nitroimidazol reductase NimA-like FMN-containing flavoprotein (pyridoxamine 5'-phosphate oxidase superfamily)
MLDEALIQLLKQTATVKISTASHRGAPWVAAAFFAEDGPFSLRVLLEARGRTLANLRANPRVALMIENGNAFSLFAQAEGSVKLVEQEHALVRDAIAKKTPASARMVALPNLVVVRIDVECWRLTDVSAGWLPAKELSRSSPPSAAVGAPL